jgi:preprotein translocase subunit SecG
MDYLAAIMLMLSGIFLILLVLVQRGRGGGLAGAFGGMGGQSAFGTKAGDVFTRITVIVAVIWVVLAGLSILAFQANSGGNFQGGEEVGASLTAGPGDEEDKAGADDDKVKEEETEKSNGDEKSGTPGGSENGGSGDTSESESKETSSNESPQTSPADDSTDQPE